ncbi:uncharacterized protein DNG_07310 [Cephalotrichum gorgonifer]|uniref:Uncharacterized protein n=1 Tax=Cephalotrichum gorgonifer TaxID=2041049 RepID=A0AAE8N1I7_9PEZI|nr:uncharacterized protein DNG_07310 [Cephalotrichum gorgonifer]
MQFRCEPDANTIVSRSFTDVSFSKHLFVTYLKITQVYCVKNCNSKVFGERLRETTFAAKSRVDDRCQLTAEPDYDTALQALKDIFLVDVIFKNPAIRSIFRDKRKSQPDARGQWPLGSFNLMLDIADRFHANFQSDGSLRDIDPSLGHSRWTAQWPRTLEER